MPLRTDLLEPIPGDNPAGQDVTYELIVDELQEARREDLDVPQGDWERPLKRADHATAVKIAEEILATRSKDLAIAAWLTESHLYVEGFAGLREGLSLVLHMLEQFWDHLYPELENDDLELRAGPLNWLGSKLEMSIRRQALNQRGHDYIAYTAAQLIPTEEVASADEEAGARRAAAIEAEKVTPEEFQAGVEKTTKAWYKTLVADLQGCLEVVDALDALGTERFGSYDAPSYRILRQSLQEIMRAAQPFLDGKLAIDPDPIEPESVPVFAEASTGEGTTGDAAAGPRGLSPEPTSVEDATARIAASARYLRRADPTNPSPYLLLRGFRWGELRTGNRPIEPKLLDAPPTANRKQLKILLLDGGWAELLDQSEELMATPYGRGWLDLQRYTLTACQNLGADYNPLARALTGELSSLLSDLPELLDMTLMDDTPTANAQTRAWLTSTVMSDRPTGTASVAGVATVATRGPSGAHAVVERARTMVQGGKPNDAVRLLMAEADRQTSERDRFLTQAEAAAIMVDGGMGLVALPILRDLYNRIEQHGLDDWEAGAMVARALGLLYRCLDTSEPDLQQNLYDRICRLDPVQAMNIAGSDTPLDSEDATQDDEFYEDT